VHLIPLHTMGNATFQNKVSLSDDEFKDIAQRIRAKLL